MMELDFLSGIIRKEFSKIIKYFNLDFFLNGIYIDYFLLFYSLFDF
jgi:hypothetical protein